MAPPVPGVGGSYLLLVDLVAAARIRFGAAGPRDLADGRYAYVGSDRRRGPASWAVWRGSSPGRPSTDADDGGPGGFARLERHREVARGERATRHWHVDHLLGHAAASVAGDRRFPPAVGECELAAAVQGEDVEGVGATDCRCRSHLLRVGGRR